MRKVIMFPALVAIIFIFSACWPSSQKDNPEKLAKKIKKKVPKDEKWEAPPPGMVLVPSGEFLMGSHDRRNYYSQYVKAFYIDKYEVTCAQYERFIKSKGFDAPPDWIDGQIPPGKENHPVTGVSLEEAEAYAKWAGKRLPDSFEWEKAARGFKANTWPWGNFFKANYCNSEESYINGTTPVGTYSEGMSPYGCYDMSGNVWEWTTTEYDPPPDKDRGKTIYEMWTKSNYWKQLPGLMERWRKKMYRFRYNPPKKKAPKADPYETSPRLYILRGGAWDSTYLDTRTYSIMGLPRDFRHSNVGFRCVMDALPKRPERPR